MVVGTKGKSWLSIGGAGVVIVALLATLLVFTPQAKAQDRNLVAFGDSIMADPQVWSYLSPRQQREAFDQGKCPTTNNYAKQAAAKMGLPVEDFSCAGAVSMGIGKQLSWQIDNAISRGKLTPATERVIFTSGFNDTYQNLRMDLPTIRQEWVKRTAPIVERIKQAAPNARIQIVGYPTIGMNGRFCLIRAGGRAWDSTPLPFVTDLEVKAQWMQVDLAAATGTEFLDLKPITQNRGMCGSNEDRIYAGIVDFDAGPGNLPLHVNARGHEFIGEVIANS